ncbi:LPS translocon maturation chaperone LptM [Glaciecola petra]|uniref:LPS translocon maturation chaperone LptM n=1 Tax=Glaciecola petra TaxID=3075602 RepID=UPI003D787FE8
MRKLKTMTLAVFILLALFGCGQRGPLYLPEEPPANTQPEKQESFTTTVSTKRNHL